MKTTITIMILTICAGVSFAAETDVNSLITVKRVGDSDKYVSEAEYWVIRSHASTELIPFLTRTRREAKGYYNTLTDYIKDIGRGQDFLNSDITGPSSPAEYVRLIGRAEEFEAKNIKFPEKFQTWDQLVDLAMEFVLHEGYIPTDVTGPEEIEMFKQICDRKEKYGRKVQTDLRKTIQDCLNMKAYLDSINQFEAYVKSTRYQKEQKEQARKEELKRRREDRAAVGRAKRETDKEMREDIKRTRQDVAVENRLYRERQRRFGYTYYRGRYRRGYHY